MDDFKLLAVKTCTKCSGAGKTADRKACEKCHGAGTLQEPIDLKEVARALEGAAATNNLDRI